MDSLMDAAVPGISFGVFKRNIAESAPFLEEHRCGIFPLEVGTESFFKTAAERHCSARFFLPPAIQIAIAVAPRTAQVLANLTVAIDHLRSLVSDSHRRLCRRVL